MALLGDFSTTLALCPGRNMIQLEVNRAQTNPRLRRLPTPAAKRTGLTEAFTGRLARGIRNRLMDELADVSDPALPFPLQHAFIQTVAAPASVREIPDLMTVWAGQSAGLCRCTDATEFMRRLIAESGTFFSA
jgi:nitronate monooxygenase